MSVPYVPLAITPMGLLKLMGFIFFALMVYSGYLNKLYGATVTLLMTLFSVLVSLTFFEPLAQVVMGMASWSQKVAHGVTMIVVFLVTYVCLYALATAKLPARLEGFSKSIEGIGGALMGVLTGVVFAGFMLVALYLFPLGGYENQKETFLGSDRILVKLAAVIQQRIPWKPFEPNDFMERAKTANAPKKRRRAAETEPAGYPPRRP